MNPPTDFNYKRDQKVIRPVDPYVPHKYDACQSPPYAVEPLLPYLRPEWIIWEPAAGEEILVRRIQEAGFKTCFSDIVTGQNFFDYQPGHWDALVTNPPFSIKFLWLERCYELGKPFALLLPVEILGTQKAQQLFQKYGLEILLLNRRVNFIMPNKRENGKGAQFATFWLCWQMLPQPIVYGEIHR